MINPTTTYMNLCTKVIFLGLASDQKFQLQKGHCWRMVNCFKIWTNPNAPILDIDQAARIPWQLAIHFLSIFSQSPFVSILACKRWLLQVLVECIPHCSSSNSGVNGCCCTFPQTIPFEINLLMYSQSLQQKNYCLQMMKTCGNPT
jgi:hypothetical protein